MGKKGRMIFACISFFGALFQSSHCVESSLDKLQQLKSILIVRTKHGIPLTDFIQKIRNKGRSNEESVLVVQKPTNIIITEQEAQKFLDRYVVKANQERTVIVNFDDKAMCMMYKEKT